MTDVSENWLEPEDALSRFKKPEKHLLNKQETEYESKASRYGFMIDNMGFLISENTLSEIVRNADICPLPNTKDWMKGLVNVRGNLVPVYDMSLVLGVKGEGAKYNNLLVLDTGSQSVGILIEGLPQSCDVDSWHKISDLPCQLIGFKEHVSDVYTSDDMVWMDFNQKSYFESLKTQMII